MPSFRISVDVELDAATSDKAEQIVVEALSPKVDEIEVIQIGPVVEDEDEDEGDDEND